MIIFLAQAAGIGVYLGNTVAALVIYGQQFRFFGFDLLVDFCDRSWLENRVGLALGRHTGVNGFSHELTLEEVGAVVLRPGFVIGRFHISVFGQFRFIGIFKPGILSVPFGGSAHFGFAADAQLGNCFGELFSVSVELLNNRCLAGLHLGELFLLIIGQADSVLAHSIVAGKGFLKLGLGAGLLRSQLGELVFALCSLALDGRQLAIELGNFGFLDHRLLQHLAGWSH